MITWTSIRIQEGLFLVPMLRTNQTLSTSNSNSCLVRLNANCVVLNQNTPSSQFWDYLKCSHTSAKYWLYCDLWIAICLVLWLLNHQMYREKFNQYCLFTICSMTLHLCLLFSFFHDISLANPRDEICPKFYTAGFSGQNLYIVNFT